LANLRVFDLRDESQRQTTGVASRERLAVEWNRHYATNRPVIPREGGE
jgi:hypothetical protein